MRGCVLCALLRDVVGILLYLQRLRIALTPNNWGPARACDRKAWEELLRNNDRFRNNDILDKEYP